MTGESLTMKLPAETKLVTTPFYLNVEVFLQLYALLILSKKKVV